MWTSPPCPECQRGYLVWQTRVTAGRPVDLFLCESCGHVFAEEDWHVPLRSPRPNSCRNCGGSRQGASCVDCGLSVREDFQVHDELRKLIDPGATLLEAARFAVEGGRKLLALKLASAAVQEREAANEAWALRMHLLMDLGAIDAAATDGRDWTAGPGAEYADAWALYGDALLARDEGARAIDYYEQAVALDPERHDVRAKLTRCLLAMARFAKGREQALHVLRHAPADSQAAQECRELMGLYASRLISRGDLAAVHELLEELGDQAEQNGTLLLAVAWQAQQRGDTRGVKRALKRARELNADPHLLEDAEAALLPKRRTWWSWT